MVDGQDNYHKRYGRGHVMLDRSQPFPAQLAAEFRIASVDPGKMEDPKTGTIIGDMHYSPNLEISFTLDGKFKEAATRGCIRTKRLSWMAMRWC
ncbi:hypothetical protein [Paenibacillus sp. PK3_47]|uniref:hypothetical protein n=1 Tax=Paenibacillus sp. PK3_47 TaxID=2072642 RepID=UPI00201E164A|nr:hypothetical protein [Paenibacillus sp. PK3_47]